MKGDSLIKQLIIDKDIDTCDKKCNKCNKCELWNERGRWFIPCSKILKLDVD